MRAVFAYIRVSTVKQGEKGSSLSEQKIAIEHYAGKHNLEISAWFEEKETAAKQGRTQFNAMLAMLVAGRATGVIIHKIDRGARNLRDWADLGSLIDRGVEVHFAHESLDMQTRGGRLAADIQAVVAADYIRNLRDEVKKGLRGRFRQGLYPLPAPLGYLDQGKAKPKILDPLKAPLVREAFTLYASGEFNLRTLGAELHRRGLRNRRGGRVSKAGLSSLLNNEFYYGLLRVHATQETYQGIHEPLISKSLFDTVHDILQGKKKHSGLKHQFEYRKSILCKSCNYHLVPERQKGIAYYRCHSMSCKGTSIREDSITNQVGEYLRALRITPTLIAKLKDEFEHLDIENVETHRRNLISKRLHLASVEDRIRLLTDAYIDRLIDKDAYNVRNKSLLDERIQHKESIAELEARIARQKRSRATEFLELAKSIYDAIDSGNTGEMHQAMKMVTSNLQAVQKSLVPAWKNPFGYIYVSNKLQYCAPRRAASRKIQSTETRKKHQDVKSDQKMHRFAKKLYKLINETPASPSQEDRWRLAA